MSQRVERLAMEIREVLGEIVTRQEIKDPRVRDVGLITITHVRLTGDLRQVTALFTVHGLDQPALERVRQGLNSAGGYLRRRLGKELSVRSVPSVTFEIDRVFDSEERVDSLLREIADGGSGAAPAASEPDGDGEPDPDRER